jgi:protein NrfD
MNFAPSSTWFSAPPHWGWFIALYFFLGGLAGGCYLLAAIIDLLGRREDRPLARLGYYIAFPCVVVSGLLLTIDLGRPERFWHMMIESNTYRPMLKLWSPMSTGVWALLTFGLFTLLSFVAALVEDERVRWPAVRSIGARWPVVHRLRAPSPIGTPISVLGAVFGLYIAGYTGVLLAVTNRPIWSDTPLVGMLFMFSAASTSAALMIFLAHRYGWTPPGVDDMHRFEDWAIVLELIALVAVVVSLGPVARAWLNLWGVLLVLVILLGMVAPLVLSSRRRRMNEFNMTTSAVCVLLAGLLLRVVVVFSAQAV